MRYVYIRTVKCCDHCSRESWFQIVVVRFRFYLATQQTIDVSLRMPKRPRSVTPPPAGAKKAVVTPASPSPKAAASPLKQTRHASPSVKDFKIDPEIPMTSEGVIYHLGCKAEDLADNIVLVGDPGRVPKVSAYFDKNSVNFKASHREIVIHTGTYKGVRMSVLSTGMGTDNIEIVMNEIHALKEYDVQTAEWRTMAAGKKKAPVPKVNLIRVGTCGCPQGDVEIGTLAVTRFAIGMDNTCQYYVGNKPSAAVQALDKLANDKKTGLGEVGVYASASSPIVQEAILESAKACSKRRKAIAGITASGSGFYGCQGREVGRFKGRIRIPDLVDRLGALRLPAKVAGTKEDQRVVNIEMENSAICFLSDILGYRAATVCAVIATRNKEHRAFATPDQAASAIADGIVTALDALVILDAK